MAEANSVAKDIEARISAKEIALGPSDVADSVAVVEAKIPADIRAKYEVFSYRSAAVILAESHPEEFQEVLRVLRDFTLTTEMIRKAGGNKSEIPKAFSQFLHPRKWYETSVRGDLIVRKYWSELTPTERKQRKGKAKDHLRSNEYVRKNFLDGHKIDFVKGRVALDIEWNSKDQTFDRDLYAFAAFAQCGVVDVGVLITRGESLNEVIKGVGPALKKDGSVELKSSGDPRPTKDKYGASTTWMGKLLYRLNAGRNGGCPVLAVGITPKCVVDWEGGHEG